MPSGHPSFNIKIVQLSLSLYDIGIQEVSKYFRAKNCLRCSLKGNKKKLILLLQYSIYSKKNDNNTIVMNFKNAIKGYF